MRVFRFQAFKGIHGLPTIIMIDALRYYKQKRAGTIRKNFWTELGFGSYKANQKENYGDMNMSLEKTHLQGPRNLRDVPNTLDI